MLVISKYRELFYYTIRWYIERLFLDALKLHKFKEFAIYDKRVKGADGHVIHRNKEYIEIKGTYNKDKVFDLSACSTCVHRSRDYSNISIFILIDFGVNGIPTITFADARDPLFKYDDGIYKRTVSVKDVKRAYRKTTFELDKTIVYNGMLDTGMPISNCDEWLRRVSNGIGV